MRKWLKTGVPLLIAASLTAASVIGCGLGTQTDKNNMTDIGSSTGTDAAKTTDKTAAAEKNPVTLRFSWWGSDSRHQALLAVIDAYEKKNANVHIEAEYQGYDGYYEKIMTTLSSNTAPDIIQLNKEWLPDIQGAKHYLADLSKLPVDLTTLKDNLLEISGTYNGEPDLFPCTVGGSAIVYVNMDFADRYGVDLRKQYSWNDIMELGRSIHEKDGDVYLMTADADMLNRLYVQPYLAQITGKPLVDEETYTLNFTEADATAAFQNILDLYSSDTVEPFGDAAPFAGQADQNIKWINGKIGMIADYTGSAPKYIASIDSPLDVIPLPELENAKTSGSIYGGDRGFAINDSSAEKEAAAKFLDFLMNDPESIKLCKTEVGYCPTRQSDDILIAEGVISEVQKKAVEISAQNSYTNNMISGNTDLEVIRKDLIQEVIYGDTAPAKAAKELAEQSQEVLSDLKAD